MEKEKPIVMEKTHPELFAPPHIAGKMFQIILGDWQPNSTEQNQLIDHLLRCHDCRTAVKILLSIEPEDTKIKGDPKTPASDVRLLFEEIIDSIDEKEYQNLSAYAEKVHNEGREEADQLFSTFSSHLNSCPNCQIALHEILRFLNE